MYVDCVSDIYGMLVVYVGFVEVVCVMIVCVVCVRYNYGVFL